MDPGLFFFSAMFDGYFFCTFVVPLLEASWVAVYSVRAGDSDLH
jgi:hypothetical protein